MKTGTLIVDKSTFQSLSRRHAPFLQLRYVLGLTPTLVYEVLADLTRPSVRSGPSAFVRQLAEKFGGSGGVVNVSYQELLIGELLGLGKIPMTGQIIAQGASFHVIDGEPSVFIGETELNNAILRWSAGHFRTTDLDLALAWRAATRNLSLIEFHSHAGRHGVPLRRPKSDLSDLLNIVDDLVNDRSRHRSWISYLLTQLRANPRTEGDILRRWDNTGKLSLQEDAPYTYFCLRALLAVSILWVHKLTKLESNNYIDVQYLYYLPFCQFFSSNDRLHRTLAPRLMRPDQQFLTVENLQRAIDQGLAQAKARAGKNAG